MSTRAQRLLDLVPDEVIVTQRAMFAATFQTDHSEWPELYRPEYAMLRRDIGQYRAAALALAQGHLLVRQAARREVEFSPEYAAARARAEHAGLTVTLHAEPWTGPEDAARVKSLVLDRLSADWRGVFSPDAAPYGSLNRTLMNLPGGVPAGVLAHLADVRLERPVTDRVTLIALLAAVERWQRHADTAAGRIPQNLRLFLHADRAQIMRAVELVSGATHRPLSPRRSADISIAVGYIWDLPDEHRGNVVGLARKAIRWHRDAMEREAAEVVARLGGQCAALPPVPLPAQPGITFLDTVEEIAAESVRMGHCVATYAQDAVNGWCFLFHVERDGEMATVEVSPQGEVRQAQGTAQPGQPCCSLGRPRPERMGSRARGSRP